MSKATRKWEIFPGRNRFCFNGRLIMGPDVTVFYVNVFLIVGTTLLFFIFDCPYLAIKVSPLIPVVAVCLFIFVMSSLLRTSFTDPGIIPRATADEAMYIEKQIKIAACGDALSDRPPPRTKEVIIKGQPVKLKYCFTCKIFRPPRASHCSLCDNCVEHFDHHCPWVGNCVGRRNYKYFYLFTVSLSFYIAFVFICTCTHLYYLSEKSVLSEAVAESPSSVVVLLVTFFSCWSVFGLAGFHTYLAISNQTTNEDIKGSFSTKRNGPHRNPYSYGNACSNCCYVLCGPVPISLIDRKGFVMPDIIVDKSNNRLRLHSGVFNAYGTQASTPHMVQNDVRMSNESMDTLRGSSVDDTTMHEIKLKNITNTMTNEGKGEFDEQLFKKGSMMGSWKTDSNAIYETLDRDEEPQKCENRTVDVSKIALDLDDVNMTTMEYATYEKHIAARPTGISASRLQLLQNTTMIESALDLDSLEESVSSAGAGSNVALVKCKNNNR